MKSLEYWWLILHSVLQILKRQPWGKYNNKVVKQKKLGNE